ncbi:serine/threonine protein kinase [Actinoplanes sp. TBRC 11911]|uniref:serine/threonine-protein kinase n=1 Tax=Actinoplanes sp. TBRC 11911 TaxID=2729386 RepID=UPI00145DAFEF|nr:serine/threonine-protein kinase [Actinoplanes sp. TBRC 11911]NMO52811.1 serine/threonine protein kinase [Actinoplanes sp. TBRC 11911]
MSVDWPSNGILLAARYRLAERLETGGMADVWRADDELLGRPVAVKLPNGAHVAWREARMAAKLSHPSIAAVHDYREAVRPDGTVAPFVVLELLAGETVAARLVRDPLSLDEAARVGAAVAGALAAAHAGGVVHRDIKPGNVMLTPNGVKILDFGISAPAGEEDFDDTGATFGTPAYVAPERLDGMPAVPATDVYGLGVLLFEMVTGAPPYPVDTWEELAEARASGPGTLPASLPADFRTLVGRCLNDDPSARPSADEVRFALTALWLAERSASWSAVVAPAAPAAAIWQGPAATSDPGPGHSPPGVSGPVEIMHGPAGPGEITHAPAAAAGTPPYRPGRAVASTLPMASPPARRVAVTVALIALAVAVAGVFALVTWQRKNTVDARPAPSGTVAVPPAPAANPPVPTTSPTPPLVLAEAVSRMESAVEEGAADGEIRADVAVDFLNLIRPLSAADSRVVAEQVAHLRRKITERLGEGGLQPERAELLRARLTDLDQAAGTP